MIAVYDNDGKMLYSGAGIISDGEAHVGVSNSVYQNEDAAKLFVLDGNYVPTKTVTEQELR